MSAARSWRPSRRAARYRPRRGQRSSAGSTHTWATPRGLHRRALERRPQDRRRAATSSPPLFSSCLGGLNAVADAHAAVRPERGLIGPDLYNQLFTMHGVTMMFLFAVPVMQASGIYLVPLMVGTRNIAFPRLNAFSYWIYLSGGIFALGRPSRSTWGPTSAGSPMCRCRDPSSPGKRADVWAQMITYTEVSSLAVAVATHRHGAEAARARHVARPIPLFVWSMLVTSFVIIFAMPAVMIASTFLILDRLVGTHIFNPAEGGDVLLFQHLFWFFGHPEVYIIFLPATGMVSSIVAASRAGRCLAIWRWCCR